MRQLSQKELGDLAHALLVATNFTMDWEFLENHLVSEEQHQKWHFWKELRQEVIAELDSIEI